MQRLSLRPLILPALLLLPLLLFHRALFFGEAFLPADLLYLLYPWKADVPAGTEFPPWNVLRFDGITEFYPWRRTAAEAWQSGRIPLWNPYAFAAQGGTPLLPNSQSAPLYPLNLIYYLMPSGAVWYAFGLGATLHVFLAAKGMYLFLRRNDLARSAALLGSIAFCLSAPVVTWLALPTFLAVSSWLPWLLLCILTAHEKAGTRTAALATVGAGAAGGMALLAGHLQVAFYVLLAAGLYALTLGVRGLRTKTVQPLPWLGAAIGALVLTVFFAAPQLLPSLELSRVSHRVSGPPTMEDYGAYTANALPLQSLTTLFVPDFFGHPNLDNGLYLNLSSAGRPNNYAEWANYVGVVPLLLAIVALALPWRNSPLPALRGYLVLLAGIALLLSFGSPLNLPFYFLVPGYSQTGNPARSLILFAFAIAGLSAIGLHGLLSAAIDPKAKERAGMVAAVVAVLLLALGLNFASGMAAQFLVPAGIPFSALLQRAMPGILLAGVLFVLGMALLFVVPRLSTERQPLAVGILLLLTFADLFLWGYGYNPTVPASRVYAETPGIAWLKQNAADALIAPLNRGWSISGEAPRDAILPPNTLAAYGLHDIAGYDSLFPGTYKERIREAHGGNDPSPPENGNMVFIQSVDAAVNLGAKYIVAPPGAPDLSDSGLSSAYTGADMTIYVNPQGQTFSSGRASYQPTTFRLGLYLYLTAFAFLVGFALSGTGHSMSANRRHP
ncbi:MAG: hypothetical protein OHK0029_03110 [Armatimonadaceae bacterium]